MAHPPNSLMVSLRLPIGAKGQLPNGQTPRGTSKQRLKQEKVQIFCVAPKFRIGRTWRDGCDRAVSGDPAGAVERLTFSAPGPPAHLPDPNRPKAPGRARSGVWRAAPDEP